MSADFLNFGSSALGLAADVAIIGETTKMLRNAQRQVRPTRKEVRKSIKKASSRVAKHKSILGERFDLGF